MKTHLLAIALTFAGVGQASAAPEFPAIDQTRLEHPYLYFNDEDKHHILDYIRTDPEAARVFANLKRAAETLLAQPVDKGAYRLGNEFPNGDRYRMARGAKGHCVSLAFLYQMTGELKYARKAYEFADALCAMQRWTNPYTEFDIIYDRIWPYHVKDDQAAFSVDLDTTNTALALGTVYDWLYPVLSRRERDRIRGALLEQAILPVRGNYDYHWWATAYRCNWCAVNNSNIGVAVMAILTENPELEPMIREAYERTVRTLDECALDGGWQEGYSYLAYAVKQAVGFAEPLKRLTNGQADLFQHRTLREGFVNCAINSMVPPKAVINFGDCSTNEPARVHLMNKIAEESGNGKAVWFRQNRLGRISGHMDLIWRESTVKSEIPAPVSHWFKEIGTVVLRSSFLDENQPLLSCRAGMNDDPHHGHLDAGSFNIWWQGEGYVAELGGIGYDQAYFSDRRWEDYPHAMSCGHQTISVNGEAQISAKYKDRPWKEGIGGRVVTFQAGAARDYVVLDATDAYPKQELRRWRRHVIFERPGASVILDEISARPGSDLQVIFNTKVAFENRGSHMLLQGQRGNMVLFPVSRTPFRFEERTHRVPVSVGHARQRGKVTIIPYFTVTLSALEEVSYVGTIVAPYDKDEDAAQMAASARLVHGDDGSHALSFTAAGKVYAYEFTRARDGTLEIVHR